MRVPSLSLIPLVLCLAAGCGDGPVDLVPTVATPETGPTVDLDAPLPGDSVYQLDLPLSTHHGDERRLGDTRGRPTIVSMFYASCPAACPMLISDIKAIEQQLPPGVRDQLQVVLVTFDPETDTPEALARLAADHGVDGARWTLAATPDPADVRSLAAVLGISYRRLESGHYNHSAVITLLDAQGRPSSRIEGLRQPAEPILGDPVLTSLAR